MTRVFTQDEFDALCKAAVEEANAIMDAAEDDPNVTYLVRDLEWPVDPLRRNWHHVMVAREHTEGFPMLDRHQQSPDAADFPEIAEWLKANAKLGFIFERRTMPFDFLSNEYRCAFRSSRDAALFRMYFG